MNHVRTVMLSVCSIALMATGLHAKTTGLPMGSLDSEEKYAQLWSEVVGTDYESGACAFSLGAISPALSTYIIRAVDDRMEEPLPFRVGELTVHRQDVAFSFEPVTHSFDDGQLVNILINHMTLVVVEGFAIFDGGESAHLKAHLYISNTENLTTGAVTQEIRRAFVPKFVGKDGRSKGGGRLLQPALVSPIIPGGAVGGNDVKPCNRTWTWCRDEHGFCADISMCWRQWEEDVAEARKLKLECDALANEAYELCMGDCLQANGQVVPGFLCGARHLGCNVPWGIAQAACESINFGLMTAADLNFGACKSSAEANNSGNYPGCDCPGDMVPFPNQRPPKWGDAPCQPYFDNLGIPGNWEERVFPGWF